MRFLVSRTFETVYGEPTEFNQNGESDERGFLFQDEPMDFREVVEGLQTDTELSRSPVRRPADCVGIWSIQTEDPIPSTGDQTTYSRFIRHSTGRELTGREMFRLYRAAGLLDTTVAV